MCIVEMFLASEILLQHSHFITANESSDEFKNNSVVAHILLCFYVIHISYLRSWVIASQVRHNCHSPKWNCILWNSAPKPCYWTLFKTFVNTNYSEKTATINHVHLYRCCNEYFHWSNSFVWFFVFFSLHVNVLNKLVNQPDTAHRRAVNKEILFSLPSTL